jgi:hypothetical protein
MKKLFLRLTVIVFIVGSNTVEAKENDSIRVLFVGNSYTYFWNLPQTVQAMAVSQNLNMKVRKSTAGGTNWKQHWEGDKGLKTKELIAKGNWDVVVLQNHSLSSMNNSIQFMDYGDSLINWAKDHKAKVVLFQTWARAFNPLMMSKIAQGYDLLGQKHTIEVVRIGELWAKAKTLQPSLNLYHPDQSHPSPVGTYLTACAFFQYFSGIKAGEIEPRISKLDQDGEVLFLAILTQEQASFLQGLVEQEIKVRLNE